MAFIPNLRSRAAVGAPQVNNLPYVDTPFDYGAFWDAAEAIGAVGRLSDPSVPLCIVGAGIAGLAAAYELLRAGAQNLTIYEARPTLGGRTDSSPFTPKQPQYLAELGAMRFPPSEILLFRLFDRFGIATGNQFPDPGKVLTKLMYKGTVTDWPANQPPPAQFAKVGAAWNALVSNGVTIDGVKLAAPAQITNWLMTNQISQATAAWQQWIDLFENKSFYNGLMAIFSNPAVAPPGGEPWLVPEDYQLFGALGLGSGGFGPLYQIGFLDILRLMVNELETDQQFVPGGIQALADTLAEQSFFGKTIRERIVFNMPVTGVVRQGQSCAIGLANGTTHLYNNVIVTTSNRAAQAGVQMTDPGGVLSPDQANAVNMTHMTNSSKVFVMTPTKFWLQDLTIPRNIQTDTLVRGVYCLGYDDDPAKPGVVLLSYTWEDDSTKQLSWVSKKERVQRLVADVFTVDPAFAAHIVPINGDYDTYTQIVDWEKEPGFFGAFKLNPPGDDVLTKELFFQFLGAQEAGTDPRVYLAGDSYTFCGGWMESPLQTAYNAVCSVIWSNGNYSGGLLPLNPLQFDWPNFNYAVTAA